MYKYKRQGELCMSLELRDDKIWFSGIDASMYVAVTQSYKWCPPIISEHAYVRSHNRLRNLIEILTVS